MPFQWVLCRFKSSPAIQTLMPPPPKPADTPMFPQRIPSIPLFLKHDDPMITDTRDVKEIDDLINLVDVMLADSFNTLICTPNASHLHRFQWILRPSLNHFPHFLNSTRRDSYVPWIPQIFHYCQQQTVCFTRRRQGTTSLGPYCQACQPVQPMSWRNSNQTGTICLQPVPTCSR